MILFFVIIQLYFIINKQNQIIAGEYDIEHWLTCTHNIQDRKLKADNYVRPHAVSCQTSLCNRMKLLQL